MRLGFTLTHTRLPLVGLLAFKANWLLLVVGQSRWLWAALLLLVIHLLCTALAAPAGSRLLPLARSAVLAATGIAADTVFTRVGLLHFDSGSLPLWLLLLWCSFALALPLLEGALSKLPRWALVLASCAGGLLSYRAGVALDAVRFSDPAWPSLLALGLFWALLLPTWQALPRLSARAAAGAVLVVFSLLPGASRAETAADSWRLVGEGQFSAFFLDIYHAKLEAAAPEFRFPESAPYRLTLTYQRNIPAARLVEETGKQWRRQGVRARPEWLAQLHDCLPSIRRGDTLSLLVTPARDSQLFHNGRLLAQISDSEFTDAFAGIWLSERTTRPEFRQTLLGLP